MNFLFDCFSGGVIFEVRNESEAELAEKAGAVAVLLEYSFSPLSPEGDSQNLTKILNKIDIPVLSAFHPGHLVEAELLCQMGIWGIYADSRIEQISLNYNFSKIMAEGIAVLADIDLKNIKNNNFAPVLRGETLNDIVQGLKIFKKHQFKFVAGPIKTVSDVALLKRFHADAVIIPYSVFEVSSSVKYLSKLVKASFYFDNMNKLAALLSSE